MQRLLPIILATAPPPPATYTVTFNANGGTTPSPTSKVVTVGQTYGTLATSTRENQAFPGWFTAATGGTEVTASTTVALFADQTLYAQWAAQVATVGGAEHLAYTFTPAASDLRYIIEVSSDLSDWSDASDIPPQITPGQPYTFIDPVPLDPTTTPRRFLRLRVLAE